MKATKPVRKGKASSVEYDDAPPRAAALVESLRAFGYELPTALADLVDNSIFANARHVWLHFHWAGAQSAIAVVDDGDGMDEQTLLAAMRPGSTNPRDPRDPRDLGRFGLGLKTASFSQGRRVTVRTRRKGGPMLTRSWDLDHIAKVDAWQLLRSAGPRAVEFSARLDTLPKGTAVIWENMDRIVADARTGSDAEERAFLSQADAVRAHLAAVFHRFLSGPRALQLLLNDHRIEPWDPFLSTEDATQHRPTERLKCAGAIVEVEPFVLPHLSKVDPETHRSAAGTRGWNAHQGFYIYRNRRLLVAGDWLGLGGWKAEEHYKLARIRVDVPNSLDHAWGIDVTKSKAHPPVALRADLERIGRTTRSLAKQVYSFRGAKLMPVATEDRVFLWEQRAKHHQVSYRLNREHPLIRAAAAACSDKAKLRALLRLIEETIPVPLITITDREKPDQTIGPFESAKEDEVLDVMRQVFAALRTGGLSRPEALKRLAHFEPFPRFPALLATVAEEKELSK